MNMDKVSRHMARKMQLVLPKMAAAHVATSQTGPPPINLSSAENQLIQEEILALMKKGLHEQLSADDLAYAKGFGGDSELLSTLATFFNRHLHPHQPIEPDHIITASGAGNALDALIFSICEDGDKVLVLGPCWEGFANYFLAHANVEALAVDRLPIKDALSFDAVEALRNTYQNHPQPERIKAVVITNPNNPIGQCYAPEVIRECLHFCSLNGLHLISDEVYALSSFRSQAIVPPFVSVLSLLSSNPETDIEQRYNDAKLIDPSLVHVVWSLSKDFGCSGIRLGCIISQDNPALRMAAGFSSYWQISSLTSVAAKALLKSPKLPSIMKLNSHRLSESYRLLTSGLSRLNISYIPASAGLFVLARVAPEAQSWEEEREALVKLAEHGLLVAPGNRFCGNENDAGWMRITFSYPPSVIAAALERLEAYVRATRTTADAQDRPGRLTSRTESPYLNPATSSGRCQVAGILRDADGSDSEWGYIGRTGDNSETDLPLRSSDPSTSRSRGRAHTPTSDEFDDCAMVG